MLRPARVDELGLTVFSEDPHCLGEHCRVTRAGGQCGTDRHHRYWPLLWYATNDLAWEFRNLPENISWSPLCFHRDYHDRYKYAARPSPEVMGAFVEESKAIRQLGMTVRNIEVKWAVLEGGLVKDESPLYEELDWLEGEVVDLRSRVSSLEVIRPELAVRSLGLYLAQTQVQAQELLLVA